MAVPGGSLETSSPVQHTGVEGTLKPICPSLDLVEVDVDLVSMRLCSRTCSEESQGSLQAKVV